jgi:hypothetical protein
MLSGNDNRTVTLAGIDITKWITQLSKTPRSKSDWGAIPTLAPLNITVSSSNKEFDIIHPASFLFGKRIDKLPLIITQFGQVQWSGFLDSASSDLSSKRTTLTGESILQQKIHRSARLDTNNPITPALAVQNLLTIQNVPTDPTTFALADDILNDTPCLVQVHPKILTWEGTLADLLTSLCAAGIGRLYLTQNGAIGFDSFATTSTPPISLTITDSDLMDWPTIHTTYADPVSGYTIVYLNGTATSGSQTSDKLKRLDFGINSAVQFKDLGSAVYCGDTWQKLSRRNYIDVDIFINHAAASILELGNFIQLNSVELGITQPGEIVGIDSSDARYARLSLLLDQGESV